MMTQMSQHKTTLWRFSLVFGGKSVGSKIYRYYVVFNGRVVSDMQLWS